jgi:hypothetical protein
MTDTCGSTDTITGEPCQRPAGWGTDRESGYCRTHEEGGEEPGGRDPKLTKERQDRIAQSIAEGKSIVSAARMTGITPKTVYNWLERGQDADEGIYAEFFQAFTRAKGHGEDYYVETILDIATEEGDLATLMSMLKQRYPDSWQDVDRGEQASGVIVNTGADETVTVDPETLEVVDGDG